MTAWSATLLGYPLSHFQLAGFAYSIGRTLILRWSDLAQSAGSARAHCNCYHSLISM